MPRFIYTTANCPQWQALRRGVDTGPRGKLRGPFLLRNRLGLIAPERRGCCALVSAVFVKSLDAFKQGIVA
jgi:hypothetical protein